MSAKKENKDWSPIELEVQLAAHESEESDFKISSQDEEVGILNFFNIVAPNETISDDSQEIIPEVIKEELNFFSSPAQNTNSEHLSIDPKYQLNLFYQIKNLNSFYKTARSYLADYNHGVRSFAIACEYAGERPSLNALALASFFQSKIEGLSVFTLAPKSVLEKFEHESRVERIKGKNCGVDINLYHYGPNMTAISLEELAIINSQLDNFKEFFEVMKILVSRYDVSFWSLPHYNELKDMKKFLFILTNFVQNVSIVIRRGKTTQRGLRDLKRFFQNYNVPVKGVLVEGQ